MKKRKKALALILAAAMLLCMTGCGSFESKMVKAVKKMNSLQSYHMDMDMQIGMSMAMLGQSLDMDMSMSCSAEMQEEPARGRLDMNVEVMGESQQVLLYFEQSGEEYLTYLSTDNEKTWLTQTMTLEELPAQGGNVTENFQMFIDCAESFEEAGQEEINGSAATRFDGEISGDSIQTALDASGAKEMMGQSLGTELDEDSFTDIGSIPCSLWIDNKSGRILRYDMDMTAVMQSIMDDVMKEVLAAQGIEGIELEISINQVTVSAVLSQFDQVEEIIIPDEAKAA